MQYAIENCGEYATHNPTRLWTRDINGATLFDTAGAAIRHAVQMARAGSLAIGMNSTKLVQVEEVAHAVPRFVERDVTEPMTDDTIRTVYTVECVTSVPFYLQRISAARGVWRASRDDASHFLTVSSALRCLTDTESRSGTFRIIAVDELCNITYTRVVGEAV